MHVPGEDLPGLAEELLFVRASEYLQGLLCPALSLLRDGFLGEHYRSLHPQALETAGRAGGSRRHSGVAGRRSHHAFPELFSLEEHLNLAKSRALRDAYAAREADQRKNDLVVYLAHDLKTPLTSVIGYLTLLRDEQQLSPELRARYTGIALDKAERLEDLVNEFFDITRFSLTHLELEKRPTDLSRMLEQICSEFQPQLAERDLRCVLSLPPKLPYTGDPDKLARVFDNLLRNACHYSYSDTAVLISGRQEEHEIVLTFTNAGPTIPKEKLERIFDQFFRLDSSRASHTGGAGLGLAIAKEIIQLHGGVIHAWSENEKAVFTVRLPL